MHRPKLLLTTYHQAFMKRAGGEFELFNISERLKQNGLIADIYGPFSRALEHYDAVLHFSVHGGGLELLRYVRDKHKPIVLFPNIWLSAPKPGIESMVSEYVDLAELVVFRSQAERNMFEQYFILPAQKTRLIATIADAAYMQAAPQGLFKAIYGVEEYLIGVGIIEPVKNQLSVIQALKNTGQKLVLVGGYRDAEYYAACQAAGGEHVLFINALPARSELMRSALSESQAFIECSHEPPGLSAVEAGLAGASLVVTDSPWTKEHFGEHAQYCDPANPCSILRSIQRAVSQKDATKKLTQEHLKPLCQRHSIEQLVAVLEEVCM
jgi:glycosyltransferase involved in cell wall biosynthesis